MGRLSFSRGIHTLNNLLLKRHRRPEFDTAEPFDYYGFVRTSFPIFIGEPELLKYCYHTFINSRMEADRFPKPESQFYYIWDTAAYQKLETITSDKDPLLNWAQTRLIQGRLYTTYEEASEDEGWKVWSPGARPTEREVEKVFFKYIGFERVIKELSLSLRDLVHGYTRMENGEAERQPLFVTGCKHLVEEFVRRPDIWMRFRKFMGDRCGEENGAFEIIDIRQVYDCKTEPELLDFDDLLLKGMNKEINDFRPSVVLSVDRLPFTVPDWYDEFPVVGKFWESLPDARLRPWDRKHEWFKLHPPEESRLVYSCDLEAYKILNREMESGSELGKWTRECLEAGKLYVRDWWCPERQGLPRRVEELDKKDERGWKLLPWPVNLEPVEHCPALSRAAWPILDSCVIIDRYLKEIVFVTGDPEIAGEVGSGELRNWLLRNRGYHVVHDVRQVYNTGGGDQPVIIEF